VPTNNILAYSPKSESDNGSFENVGAVSEFTVRVPKPKGIRNADPRGMEIKKGVPLEYRVCNRVASAPRVQESEKRTDGSLAVTARCVTGVRATEYTPLQSQKGVRPAVQVT